MFQDEEYIDEEIENLKDSLENNTFDKERCNNFIPEDLLEDEYSHNEIDLAHTMFMDKAREYLSNKYPGMFAMWSDWCVHIVTVNLYREIMWKNCNYGEGYKKMKESRDIIT